LLNGPRDFAWERAARADVTWSDPASDHSLFESSANSVGYLSVLRRVRDKNVMRHRENELVRSYSRIEEQATQLCGPKNFRSFHVTRATSLTNGRQIALLVKMIARSSLTMFAILLLLESTRSYASAAVDPASATAPTGTCASTITQSSSQAITLGNSVACNTGSPDFFHLDVSYWRAFNMAVFTGSQQFNVTSVSFGIENGVSGSGLGQPATVRLYTNAGGAFPGGVRTQIATTNITVTDQTQTILSVPLFATVPAGTSELVMEVFTPDGVAASNVLFIGTNAAAQTAPSYVSSVGCGQPTPIDTAAIGFPDSHVIFNVYGSCASGPPTPAVALNISTRLRVEVGDNVMIGGFIITNATTSLVLRGIGPSLVNSGISGALADPVLELRGSNGAVIFQNNNWQDDPAQSAQISAAGLALPNPLESGIASTLAPGAYTAILSGRNQTTGVGLVEIYNTNQAAGAQLANISTRGFVQTGSNVMIGGFILGGSSGNTRVAIRGIGPSLSQSGVSNVLPDPTLALHDGNGTTLISNDNWQDDPSSATQLSTHGLGLQNNLESGIFITLPPGTFTAILAGKNGGTGVGLVEVYNLQ
jgi:hypothetical protein